MQILVNGELSIDNAGNTGKTNAKEGANLDLNNWMEKLENASYVSTKEICAVLTLAEKIEKPILVEGPPGAGKTYLAKAAAKAAGAKLIRLQCYEGIDVSKAIYEYNYGKQLLYLNALRDKVSEIINGTKSMAVSIRLLDREVPFWGDEFLVRRPILEAITPEDDQPRVLLVDEIDRSDREFESLLLETLSDWSVSIPEYGTIMAKKKPLVVLTSNKTRDLSDALRRRCLYLWLSLPDRLRESKIIQTQVPGAGKEFADKIAGLIQEYRKMSPKHVPSISEAVELAAALLNTAGKDFKIDDAEIALSVFVKNKDDIGLGKKAVEKTFLRRDVNVE